MPLALPEHFEAGTLPTPAIASLYAGINFINQVGIYEIEKKLEFLTEEAKYILKSLKDVSVYGGKSGIISFTHSKIPSYFLADMLNKNGIAVRSGLHCAPLVHERLGTINSGTVRISFSYLNEKRELDKLYKVLKKEISLL